MLGRFLRPTLGLLLTAATASAAVLPPSHIHLGADDDDHHHAGVVEHAHWAGHFQTQPAFDDNDHAGRVLFVDHPALVRVADVNIAPPPVAVVRLLALLALATSVETERRTAGNAARDGPALPTLLLRGPPLVL
jgi:hypothetical protein